MHSSEPDAVVRALGEQLLHCRGRVLWIAEEQPVDAALTDKLALLKASYFCNRIDQVAQAKAGGVRAVFSDFASEDLGGAKFDHILLRVPKQRALVHYLLNSACSLLVEGGSLWLAGLKGEGIKTHVRRAESRLGSRAEKQRTGGETSIFRLSLAQEGPPLDGSEYGQLRLLQDDQGVEFWSKPGLYGWDKVDRGSALLAGQLGALYENLRGKSVLDLGCGYGYLAMQAAQLAPSRLVATDNQAGAITAARRNLEPLCADLEVLAADAGAGIEEKFDLILCNPPFHQGFATSAAASHRKFMAAIARLLSRNGRALVVVNAFLRLENLCRELGLELRMLEAGRSDFSLLELRRMEVNVS